MPKSEMLTRVELAKGDSRMNVYLDANPRLKVGVWVRLADEDPSEGMWNVMAVHETVRRDTIKRGWNNNI